MMDNSEFKYKVENDVIVIEKCPNDILTRDIVLELNEYVPRAEKFYLCDGIREIAEEAVGGIISVRYR
jgi:hypothetical protein